MDKVLREGKNKWQEMWEYLEETECSMNFSVPNGMLSEETVGKECAMW
jgi:hypothetical protein